MYDEPTDPYEDEERFQAHCKRTKTCPDCGEHSDAPQCCTNQR